MSKLEISERVTCPGRMLAVQAGVNPQIVRMRLEAFFTVKVRDVLLQTES
jgi:hypothetical protein